MQLIIHQSFYIHSIKVGAITNSSVLQIGSTGSIQALSESYNTGGFTQPAGEIPYTEPPTTGPIVPLAAIGK
ncbi:spore germination protein GerPB [Virgibacillus halophilus]|uniref:Spore germination protein GerPB n=1 Tax=Tigheibacillus halophilus TaxID=361280 RepID=A0ABU5CBW3_9BACI|nr:spore germination protein GerPB [Virgibacillus halophilus]